MKCPLPPRYVAQEAVAGYSSAQDSDSCPRQLNRHLLLSSMDAEVQVGTVNWRVQGIQDRGSFHHFHGLVPWHICGIYALTWEHYNNEQHTAPRNLQTIYEQMDTAGKWCHLRIWTLYRIQSARWYCQAVDKMTRAKPHASGLHRWFCQHALHPPQSVYARVSLVCRFL